MTTALATVPLRPRRKPGHWVRIALVAGALLALYGWTFTSIDIRWDRVFSEHTLNSLNRVVPQLFRPDWHELGRVSVLMWETVQMAYTGTLMAAVLSVPLGFFSASNMVRNRAVNQAAKAVLSAIRAFPELVLALMFVAAIGPAPFAGVLAIAVGSIGMLGKLFCEVIESIDMQVVESLEANGANKWQVMVFGVMPQVLPEFLSYTLYRFEIDIRASTILGIIGAGGIGTLITIATANRNWSQMGMILLVIVVVVTLIDLASARLRQRLV